MEHKRYSLRTAGSVLNMTVMAVTYRAKKLGINTSFGITAADVKAIRNWTSKSKRSRKSTEADLRKGLEVLG